MRRTDCRTASRSVGLRVCLCDSEDWTTKERCAAVRLSRRPGETSRQVRRDAPFSRRNASAVRGPECFAARSPPWQMSLVARKKVVGPQGDRLCTCCRSAREGGRRVCRRADVHRANHRHRVRRRQTERRPRPKSATPSRVKNLYLVRPQIVSPSPPPSRRARNTSAAGPAQGTCVQSRTPPGPVRRACRLLRRTQCQLQCTGP